MVQISAQKNLKRKISEQKYFWKSQNFDFFWKFFPWWGYKKKNCNLTTEKKFSKKKFFFWLLRLSSFFFKKSKFSKFFQILPKWCIRGNLGQFFVFLHYFGVKTFLFIQNLITTVTWSRLLQWMHQSVLWASKCTQSAKNGAKPPTLPLKRVRALLVLLVHQKVKCMQQQ